MKKNIPKELILQTCLQKQQELIDSFTKRVDEIKTDTYSQEQSLSQTEDRAAGNIELLSTIESELQFSGMEMGFLKSINADHVNDKVEPGAVVVTDVRTFFIAVSSEKVEVEGQEVFGISTNAPIYSVMQDLKKGDTFEFNKTRYKIEAVY